MILFLLPLQLVEVIVDVFQHVLEFRLRHRVKSVNVALLQVGVIATGRPDVCFDEPAILCLCLTFRLG